MFIMRNKQLSEYFKMIEIKLNPRECIFYIKPTRDVWFVVNV